MKVIIIDDDKTSIEMLSEKLKSMDGIQLVGTDDNGDEGVNLVKIVQRFLIEHKESGQKPVEQKDGEKLLLYVNANDFSVVNIRDVALFQYNHDLRIWEVMVAGKKEPVRLKRSANNEALLSIDSRFVQVSPRHIININYLMEVSNGICRLYPPFDHIENVKVGRTFRKQLTDRFSTL